MEDTGEPCPKCSPAKERRLDFDAFFLLALATALTVALVWRDDETVLIAAATVGTVVSLFDLAWRLKTEVPYTRLLIFNYFLQFFLAAVFLHYFPPIFIYDIGDRYGTYLGLAVPGCLALYLGVGVSGRFLSLPRRAAIRGARDLWGAGATRLFWVGLGVSFTLGTFASIPAIAFVVVLLGNLRFVGFFTLVLNQDRRWWKYGILLGAFELANAVGGGMFGDLLIWGGAAFLVMAHRFRWRGWAIGALLVGVCCMSVLQGVKTTFRELTWSGDLAVGEKFAVLGELLASQVRDTSSLLNPEVFPLIVVRFNEGWVVSAVMENVPALEPFARGETLWTGLYAAFVPRLIDPNKKMAGGRENFLRFTGRALGENTAINISVMGELYANFGTGGCILGMGLFGILLGSLFTFMASRAAVQPSWYAWAPFIGYFTLKPEEGLMECLTWVVKAAAVMCAVTLLFSRTEALRKKALRSSH